MLVPRMYLLERITYKNKLDVIIKRLFIVMPESIRNAYNSGFRKDEKSKDLRYYFASLKLLFNTYNRRSKMKKTLVYRLCLAVLLR